jgi:hypothetical protein
LISLLSAWRRSGSLSNPCAVETAARTAESWKTLEQADLLPKEMRASIEKEILGPKTLPVISAF